MSLKGQTFMPDYLASLLVFAAVVAIFLSSWNAMIENQTIFSEEEEMRTQAERTSMFLISTPGHPENWEDNPNSIEVPGFASPDHVLQYEKLDAFNDSLDYDQQRSLLQAQNFYMEVRNDSGPLTEGGEKLIYGKNYTNATTIVPVTRNVQVNISGDMKTARLQYVVWRE